MTSDQSKIGRSRQKAGMRPVLLSLLILVLWGCTDKTEYGFQGYAEGEFVLVAAPIGGRLESLPVQRGGHVSAGDLLFSLDQTEEQAAVKAAERDVERTASRLSDLRKGQRPSELRVIEARVNQARASLDLAEEEFRRRNNLLRQDAISQEEYDRFKTALARDRAQLAGLQSELETARLGSRQDVIAAGEADLDIARARLEQARWALTEKSQYARQDALVFDTLYEPGEFVQAGFPVVSLLPPGNIKVRFFVPETRVAELQVGQTITVTGDGLQNAIAATIAYISPRVEYTPPVIYSRQTRAKLVFMIEARPESDAATRLHPGQPLEVHPEKDRG